METSEMAVGDEKWVLLAEDDKLFATLFVRFWHQLFPDVRVRTATSNREVLELLQGRAAEPLVAVLDLNLEDGSSEHLEGELSCPTLLWSASSANGCRHKPLGRAQLTQALQEIARMGQLDVSS